MNKLKLSSLTSRHNRANFVEDFENNHELLEAAYQGKRVLVLGAAGSIGSCVVNELISLELASLVLIDNNENALVDLLRSIRSNPKTNNLAVAINSLSVNSPIFHSWLSHQNRFDFILNFAAAKHVRAERDIFSICQMFETNFSWIARNVQSMEKHGIFFSVSTDKAASPKSFMGLSKLIMEQVMIHHFANSRMSRFANVAYSNGSLLNSWMDRVKFRQVLSVPQECYRYFVSLEDSGKICLLSTVLSDNAPCIIPDISGLEARNLQEVLSEFLAYQGYEPEFFASTEDGFQNIEKLIIEKKWPVIVTALDTSGEKGIETFTGTLDTLGTFLSETLCELFPAQIEKTKLQLILKETELIQKSTFRKREIDKFLNVLSETFPVFFDDQENRKSLDSRV